jgi:hypothetical protein
MQMGPGREQDMGERANSEDSENMDGSGSIKKEEADE